MDKNEYLEIIDNFLYDAEFEVVRKIFLNNKWVETSNFFENKNAESIIIELPISIYDIDSIFDISSKIYKFCKANNLHFLNSIDGGRRNTIISKSKPFEKEVISKTTGKIFCVCVCEK